jgi:hypothetical protein
MPSSKGGRTAMAGSRDPKVVVAKAPASPAREPTSARERKINEVT